MASHLRSILVSALLVWALPLLPAPQASAQVGYAPGGEVRTVRITLDQASILRAPSKITGIVVGNPSVVGITIQDEKTLFLTGKLYGATNLLLVGKDGETLFEGRISVVQDQTNIVTLQKRLDYITYNCDPACKRQLDPGEQTAAFNSYDSQAGARTGAAAR